VLELITANLALAVIGCHTAVNHFIGRRRAGAIVNISSHQAQRRVRGALPYATAKAAVEGLTRAVAVDHGPDGIRANAVAPGSISTAGSRNTGLSTNGQPTSRGAAGRATLASASPGIPQASARMARSAQPAKAQAHPSSSSPG